MNKEIIIKALQSEKYSDLLMVYNHYKTDDSFKGSILRFDKFFNNANPQNTGDIHFSMLRARVRDILRIMSQPTYIEKENELPVVLSETNQNKFNGKTNKFERTERVTIFNNPNVDYNELPANLKILFKENGRLESDKKSMHSKMRLMTQKNQASERKQLLENLEKMNKKQQDNWKKIDSWFNENKTKN
jgi:hypothetical protein